MRACKLRSSWQAECTGKAGSEQGLDESKDRSSNGIALKDTPPTATPSKSPIGTERRPKDKTSASDPGKSLRGGYWAWAWEDGGPLWESASFLSGLCEVALRGQQSRREEMLNTEEWKRSWRGVSSLKAPTTAKIRKNSVQHRFYVSSCTVSSCTVLIQVLWHPILY